MQNPEFRIQKPEARSQNPEARIQNPESRMQNPEARIQKPEWLSPVGRLSWGAGFQPAIILQPPEAASMRPHSTRFARSGQAPAAILDSGFSVYGFSQFIRESLWVVKT
jgi:hypothetical protein